MKNLFLLITLFFACLPGAFADDQIRAAQQYLKDQGFFYGQIDGAPGTEMTAAIKRYQIRNGLEVTGQLNQQTLAAMNLAAAPSAPPSAEQAIQPQLPPPGNPADNLPKNQSPSAPVSPPVAAPQVVSDYSVLFHRTPYENAPGVVQVDTLRRAQIILIHAGFYRGEVDGKPGPTTTQAIMRYQADAGLQRTGRLDMDTLAALDLLPHSRGPQPFNNPEPGPGRPVYRGIWIH